MKKWLKGAVVGVVLVALIISSVVFLSKPKVKPEEAERNVYKNEQFGFKLKYPADWKIESV
jgi:hypothetical protein